MKKIVLLPILILFAAAAHAQLKTTVVCPPISVDILNGKVNGMNLTATAGQVKAKLPCFTNTAEADAKCDGAVFYKDKDIYFYTGRHYVEIGEKFKGTLSIPLMGAARNGLFKWLGHPSIKDVNWDAYTTSYGILILYFNKANKINKIQYSNESAGTIKLCE
jgi:hypothetical protein